MMVTTHDFRLPKKEILRRSSDFRDVLENGTRWDGKIIRCFYKKADEKKIGFVVPKRLGKAVFRNRIKRLMREVYRHHRLAVGNFWILIMAKKSAEPIRFQEMESDFLRFTVQCGLTLIPYGSCSSDS
ncbi:ribonuclease P protein component [bacterium]|nr:ribonuclease P protein component [bacterium]